MQSAGTTKRLPHGWELPPEIRGRFNQHSSHQRSVGFERQLVMKVHRVPQARSSRGEEVYFWRNSTGAWKFSEGRDGVETLGEQLVPYANAVAEIERKSESAVSSADWFEILSDISPLLRAIDGFRDAIQTAIHLMVDSDQHELQPYYDLAFEIVRSAELLQQQSQHSIDYLVAQQNEALARSSQSQAYAAHRLNVMAAIFLPIATISSVFGMNLNHGFEKFPMMFWVVLGGGVFLGMAIGTSVLKLRSWNPDAW